jgi:hypothetical protein
MGLFLLHSQIASDWQGGPWGNGHATAFFPIQIIFS